jgi:hypothetical protein
MHYLRHALASILPLVVAVFLMPSRYFGVYDLLPLWGGVHVFLDGGDPYDFGILKQLLSSVFSGLPDTQHFVSPPWTLAVLTPLRAGSFEASRVLVLLFTISAFCVAIIRLQRMWGKLPLPCTIFIPSPFFFLCVILLSQLTAPYIWVYDSVALMPLFYAALGVVIHDGVTNPRRQIGVILTVLSVLPAYMIFGSDFSSMVCHNIILAGACVVVAPELRRHVSPKPLGLNSCGA